MCKQKNTIEISNNKCRLYGIKIRSLHGNEGSRSAVIIVGTHKIKLTPSQTQNHPKNAMKIFIVLILVAMVAHATAEYPGSDRHDQREY